MSIDANAREQTILDAAAKLIIQHGYDKTTMSDVADAVGLNRALVYAHFKSKDHLLEALIKREMRKYGELWLEHLLASPNGGTVASIHRSIAYALKNSPFMGTIVTRDKATFGKYLRKPGNFIMAMKTQNMTRDLLQSMQDAGVIRQGVNIPAVAHLMEILSNGLVEQNNSSAALDPPFEDLLETMAEMFDRMLTPAEGANLEAGKQILRRFAGGANAHFNHTGSKSEG